MNRNDLKRLANARRRDAKRLLDAGSHGGAYYLAGLAVECAIKACIAKLARRHEFPDKQHANNCYEHAPMKLIKAARLLTALDAECDNNPVFDSNWAIVEKWSVESRYDRNLTEQQAIELYSAIVASKNGVLSWL